MKLNFNRKRNIPEEIAEANLDIQTLKALLEAKEKWLKELIKLQERLNAEKT